MFGLFINLCHFIIMVPLLKLCQTVKVVLVMHIIIHSIFYVSQIIIYAF